jgi:hypothetical protein
MGTKTSKLPLMTAGQVDPENDCIPIVDVSAGVTKRIKIVDIDGTDGNNEKLRAWTLSGAYSLTSATRDVDGVITTATVSWPDGSSGTFTTTTKNATFLTVDAYTVTHAGFSRTATQSAVTRDSSGNVTAQPAITIS